MMYRLKALVESIRERFSRSPYAGVAADATREGMSRTVANIADVRGPLIVMALVGGVAYFIYAHPPFENVNRGEIGVRVNRLTGDVAEFRDGNVLVLPGVHEIRVFTLRDQTYQPEQIKRAEGQAPLQSVEGLSFGVDLSVRYALDADKLRVTSKTLPDNVGSEIVEPAVQGVIY